eukprot:m.311659 g.311659  ORF g.311659 m.311659 type:complete len:1746 (+) comp16386_c0_seq5:81-5318(+)
MIQIKTDDQEVTAFVESILAKHPITSIKTAAGNHCDQEKLDLKARSKFSTTGPALGCEKGRSPAHRGDLHHLPLKSKDENADSIDIFLKATPRKGNEYSQRVDNETVEINILLRSAKLANEVRHCVHHTEQGPPPYDSATSFIGVNNSALGFGVDGYSHGGSVDLTDRWAWCWALRWPQCSVKSLTILREWAFALKTRNGPTMVHSMIDGAFYTDDVTVEKIFELLDLAESELRSENRMTASSEQSLISFRRSLLLKDFSAAYDRSQALSMEAALVFNFWRCATLVEQSCKQSASVRGKHIALQVGVTGAGKSSLVHFWKGSRFVKGANGGPVPDPDCHVARSLEHICVSTKATSETSTTAAVEVQLGDVNDPNEVLPCEGAVHIVDCPGLSDTRGFEFAVANEISIVLTAQQAESVIILFVHSHRNTGSKLAHVPFVIGEVSRLIPSLAENLGAVRWIWTGFQDRELQSGGFLPEMISDLIRHPSADYEDSSVMNLLETLQKQGSSSQNGLRGIDLTQYIGCDPSALDETRADLLAYVLGPGAREKHTITCPKTAFQFEPSSHAAMAIKRQIDIFSSLIKSQIELFPNQKAVDVVVFVLSELEQAATHIPLSIIRSGFNTCLRLVDQYLQTLSDEAITAVERVCEQHEVMQRSAIEEYKLTIQNMEHVEQALARFRDEDSVFRTRQRLDQALSRGVNSVWKRVDEELKEDRLDSQGLSKLCTIASVFEEECAGTLTLAQESVLSHINGTLVPKLARILSIVADDAADDQHGSELLLCFDTEIGFTGNSRRSTIDGVEPIPSPGQSTARAGDLAEKMCAVIGMVLGLRPILIPITKNPSDITTMHNQTQPVRIVDDLIALWRSTINSQLKELQDKTIQIIKSRSMLSTQNLKRCRRWVEFLWSVQARADTFQLISLDVTQHFKVVTQSVDAVISEAYGDVTATIEQNKAGRPGLAVLEETIARLRGICRWLGPALLNHTEKRWVNLLANLACYLKDVKRDMATAMLEFRHEESDTSIERLWHNMTVLESAVWIDVHVPSAVEDTVKEEAGRFLKAVTFKINAVSSVDPLCTDSLALLDRTQKLESIVPNLQDLRIATITKCAEYVQAQGEEMLTWSKTTRDKLTLETPCDKLRCLWDECTAREKLISAMSDLILIHQTSRLKIVTDLLNALQTLKSDLTSRIRMRFTSCFNAVQAAMVVPISGDPDLDNVRLRISEIQNDLLTMCGPPRQESDIADCVRRIHLMWSPWIVAVQHAIMASDIRYTILDRTIAMGEIVVLHFDAIVSDPSRSSMRAAHYAACADLEKQWQRCSAHSGEICKLFELDAQLVVEEVRRFETNTDDSELAQKRCEAVLDHLWYVLKTNVLKVMSSLRQLEGLLQHGCLGSWSKASPVARQDFLEASRLVCKLKEIETGLLHGEVDSCPFDLIVTDCRHWVAEIFALQRKIVTMCLDDMVSTIEDIQWLPPIADGFDRLHFFQKLLQECQLWDTPTRESFQSYQSRLTSCLLSLVDRYNKLEFSDLNFHRIGTLYHECIEPCRYVADHTDMSLTRHIDGMRAVFLTKLKKAMAQPAVESCDDNEDSADEVFARRARLVRDAKKYAQGWPDLVKDVFRCTDGYEMQIKSGPTSSSTKFECNSALAEWCTTLELRNQRLERKVAALQLDLEKAHCQKRSTTGQADDDWIAAGAQRVAQSVPRPTPPRRRGIKPGIRPRQGLGRNRPAPAQDYFMNATFDITITDPPSTRKSAK